MRRSTPWWGEITGALVHNDLRRWQIRARSFRMNRKKVVLIDGDQLADLMIEHGLGVVTAKTYELKEVSDSFLR